MPSDHRRERSAALAVVELGAERMATGGEAVGRLEDGRVVFIQGAMPGERVRAEITQEKKSFVRAKTMEIVDPSPHRREPSCQHALSQECGGCDWMHIASGAQREFKHAIVVEQLQRLGGVGEPDVVTAEMTRGQRTTVRCAVVDGRAGYRGRHTAQSFAAASCSAVHPGLEELIVDGHYGQASEVVLRIGAQTGERLVVTNGDPGQVRVPADVLVARRDDPGDAAIHERVAGRSWRISANSFFQTSYEGAEALVTAVQDGLAGSTGDVVDLYGGVGLLGGGAAGARLECVVESNPSSVHDAKHNLGDIEVVASKVERWRARPFGAVIADPARRGLGTDGTAVVGATGAERLVLVSCDPASLGRDAALLIEQGWRYDRSTVIDMFPDTNRVEAVSVYQR